jgi:hypothetical protein
MVDYLKGKNGADGNFKSLFQDQYMKDAYENFHELLLVDATYELLDLRMPLYVLMVVDGNGLSDVVKLLIVAEESEAVITQGCKLLSDIGQCPTKFGKCTSKSNFDRTLV